MTAPLGPEVFDQFLLALRAGQSQKGAAAFAGTNLTSMRRLRERFPDKAAEWDAIMVELVDELESTSLKRAIHGYEKPIFQGGVQVGTVTEYSDQLVMFFLRAHKPAAYRDKQEVTHRGAMAVQVITGLPTLIDHLL